MYSKGHGCFEHPDYTPEDGFGGGLGAADFFGAEGGADGGGVAFLVGFSFLAAFFGAPPPAASSAVKLAKAGMASWVSHITYLNYIPDRHITACKGGCVRASDAQFKCT